MNAPSKLLIATGLVLLMAGPAYTQNKDMVILQKDILDLKYSITQMQASFDQNNQALKSLVEKVFDQVNTLSSSIARINQTVEAANTRNDQTAADIRTAIVGLNTRMSDLTETISAVRSQVSGLSSQMTSMNTKAEPLPGPDDSWRSAKLDVLLGNFDLAVQGLSEFQAKYPNDPRSADAQIMKGEAYVAQKKHEQAIIEFDLFLQKYPESDKSSLALYKKGLAQAEANDKGALATLQQVVARYPKSQEAPLATQKIKELSTAGARGRRP